MKNLGLSAEDLELLRSVEELLDKNSDPNALINAKPIVCKALIETIPRPREEFRKNLWHKIVATDYDANRRRILKRLGGRVSPVLIPVLVVLLIIFLGLTTSWGKAVAQEIIQFFTRTESNVVPGAVLRSDTMPTDYDDIETAEEAVGFNAQQPFPLPEGYIFSEVTADTEKRAISLTYLGLPTNSGVVTPRFTVTQRLTPFEFPIAPSAEIVSLEVNGLPAQYVAGGWLHVDYTPEGEGEFVDRSEKFFQWEKSMVPIQVLRWIENGYYFEVSFMGSGTVPGFLVMEDLVAIAESNK